MKISIITATYNSESTLRDTLNSVLAQTYPDYEHIIVDGNSSDSTLQIIREFEPKYKGRLRYLSEEDDGLYDAMNKGIAMAKGELVGILNSDDFYTSDNVLETIATAIQKTPCDAVYADVHYVHPHNTARCIRYYSSRFFRRGLMRFGFMPAHPSFYCRKYVYMKFGLFDLSFKVAADFENLLRLIYVGGIRTKYLPVDCVTMRTGGASSSGLSSHRQIMQDHLRALKQHGIYSNIFFLSLRYIYKILELIYSRIIAICVQDKRRA